MIEERWKQIEKLFGPKVDFQKKELINATKEYAEAILLLNDRQRITIIGKRHLKLACQKKLKSKQLDSFLVHARIFENSRV
ncbi:MAG: hypothetical protein L0M06_12315 [Enterococcus sp.]|uniref:hypothetical protein n=1 Tax=Enterococcus sp. TaxID=35783 RepID=UPI00264784C1|nr:hypothetical protein [Enterococcus sp.]MDN6777326.1 hypothetical protein [Enterococcus sp.]